MSLFRNLFQYVLSTTKNKQIDESHGVSHAMNVLLNSHKIYQTEVLKHACLNNHERVIYSAAILHDMCDKKYMNEEEGILELNRVFEHDKSLSDSEIHIVKTIIRTMSYSKVKQNGFPDLGEYQCAYHIVREADLLAAYDFDRAMIYHMYQKEVSIDNAFENSMKIFQSRIFKHETDGLLLTDYSKQQHPILLEAAKQRIQHWNTLLTGQLGSKG
jgi:hypothetical protein